MYISNGKSSSLSRVNSPPGDWSRETSHESESIIGNRLLVLVVISGGIASSMVKVAIVSSSAFWASVLLIISNV